MSHLSSSALTEDRTLSTPQARLIDPVALLLLESFHDLQLRRSIPGFFDAFRYPEHKKTTAVPGTAHVSLHFGQAGSVDGGLANARASCAGTPALGLETDEHQSRATGQPRTAEFGHGPERESLPICEECRFGEPLIPAIAGFQPSNRTARGTTPVHSIDRILLPNCGRPAGCRSRRKQLHGEPAGLSEVAGGALNASVRPSPGLGWRNRTSCADPLHRTESVPTK